MSQDIGYAVNVMRSGRSVARKGWNGKGMYIFIYSPCSNDGGLVIQPHVVMKTADGKLIPWLCSQADLLANDWEDVGEHLVRSM